AGLGWADLTSNTGYFHRTFTQQVDYTQVIPAAFGQPAVTSSTFYQTLGELTWQNVFVQEVRLASPTSQRRFTWTIGGYYSDARQNGVEYIEAPSFPGALVNGRYSFYQGERFDDEELAGFANLEYALGHGLSIIAGARVSSLTGHYYSQGEGPLF